MPASSFRTLGVPQDLVDALAERGIATPFPIQAAAIPDALTGRDVCGRAPTGSGKTLAFGLPMIARVEPAAPRRPRALVLAPTRELAEQINQELGALAQVRGRRTVAIYGGVSSVPQIEGLAAGAEIVVACPGRLADLLQQGELTLADVDQVVVDEADRMADMGFLPEVERLLDRTAPDRQTTLFSATLDGDVAVLTERYQRNPVRHEIGPVEPDLTSMAHHFWKVEGPARVECAAEVVMAVGPTVVFSRTRHGADRIARQLVKAGVAAVAIHGGRNQRQRDRALDAFAAGEAFALIATDVAARGIHVDGVNCVLHFDPPEDDKTYLHRSGRTARAGARGVVVSFVAPDQVRHVARLQRQLGLVEGITAPAPRALDAPAPDAARTVRPTRSTRYRDEPLDPHALRDRGPGEPPSGTGARRRRRPAASSSHEGSEKPAAAAADRPARPGSNARRRPGGPGRRSGGSAATGRAGRRGRRG